MKIGILTETALYCACCYGVGLIAAYLLKVIV
jgi:hypothetical protein